MGLFDIFKRTKVSDGADNTKDNAAVKAKITAEIFGTICGDKAAKIAECTASPKEYAAGNEMHFSERGISPEAADADTLMWIGCVDILIDNGYAAEFDFSCGLDEFIYGMNSLASFAEHNITLDEKDFASDADITVWLGELDEKLAKRNLCIGGIDIDSDSYVVFLTDIPTLMKLNSLAESIGHRIDYAKNM